MDSQLKSLVLRFQPSNFVFSVMAVEELEEALERFPAFATAFSRYAKD
jgi:hypothetical protein